MKFLTFSVVVVLILADYGTFQATEKSIEDLTPLERAGLFKRCALEFVYAVSQALRANEVMMNGGSECVSGVKREENLNAVDAILAIMSIAKKYYGELQTMQAIEDVSKMEITDELAENIRRILVVIDRSSLYFDRKQIDEYFRPYLLKYEQRYFSTTFGTSEYDTNLDLGMKCHNTRESFCMGYNTEFFDQLTAGSRIVRVLIKTDDDDGENDSLWTELNKINGSISEYPLTHCRFGISKDGLAGLLESLNADSDTE